MLKLYHRLFPMQHIVDTQSRMAHLLYLILFSTVFLNSLHILGIVLLSPDTTDILWFNGLLLLAQLIALEMIRRQHLQLTSWLICALAWLAIMHVGYQDGGVFTPRFLLYMPTFLLLAGSLLGWRAALYFTFLTLGGVIFLASSVGQTVLPIELLTMSTYAKLNIIIALALVGSLLAITIMNTNHTLDQAQQNAKSSRESEEKYRILFDSSMDAIFLETLDGQVLDCNEVACQLYGYTRSELLALTVWDIVPKHILAKLPKAITEGQKNGSWSLEAESKRKDGSIFPTEVNIRVITRSDEKQVIVHVRDLSDRQRSKVMQLEAERLNLELENERNLLNFKAQFLSQVSHEFRTPLSVILTSKELLENYYDRLTPERRREHFAKIAVQTQLMVDMLDDLLAINRNNSACIAFSPTPINLEACCRELIEQVEHIDRGSHQFVFNALGTFTQMELDAKLLKHSLLNLLTNATKYSPAGSVVELRLTWVDTDVVIQVIDEGIGIPPENQALIFEPFYRANNVDTVQGTGLGLMIAKNNIVAHGGTLTFESMEGVGTTFEIRLPGSSTSA